MSAVENKRPVSSIELVKTTVVSTTHSPLAVVSKRASLRGNYAPVGASSMVEYATEDIESSAVDDALDIGRASSLDRRLDLLRSNLENESST